jgi:hypothetical protein
MEARRRCYAGIPIRRSIAKAAKELGWNAPATVRRAQLRVKGLMNMKVFYAVSYKDGQTKIAFQVDDDAVDVSTLEGSELKCTYEFHRSMVERCNGRIIKFSCEPTNATKVWTEGWIESYRADGFHKKPPNHAEELKALDEDKALKRIEFKFSGIRLKKKNELLEQINPKAVRPPIPYSRGTDADGDHLPQRSESIRSLIDRAISRDRR